MTSVLVLNPYYTGVGIARSLRGTGIPVVALTWEEGTPGARSRCFHAVRRVPDGRDEPDALCAELLRLAGAFGERPVLFPTRDFDVLFLNRYEAALRPHYRLPWGDSSAAMRAMDKLALASAARIAGVAAPATVAVGDDASLSEAARNVRFPVVVKPRFAYQWRYGGVWDRVGGQKAFIVQDASELRAVYARLAAATPQVLVQEYVEGQDHDIVVCCCVMRSDGQLGGQFTGRKLKQNPPLVGTGCIVEAVDLPRLVEPTVRLLQAVGYTGIAEVEYKHDRRTGIDYLIEINPRHWDQHELGRLVGVNISLLAYADATGQIAPPGVPHYEPGMRYRWIAENDLVIAAAREFRQRTAAGGQRFAVARAMWQELRELTRGRRMLALWRLADPAPGMLASVHLLRQIAGYLRRRMRRGA